MKTKLASGLRGMKFFNAAAIAVMLLCERTQAAENGLVAHEWGTFTSLQVGDGTLLTWKPLETAELPKFVYDWKKPGLSRYSQSPYAVFGKSVIMSLQRMETPVIYFYTAEETTVDVRVKFPMGAITEWYPQAGKIGPSGVYPSQNLVAMDKLLHRAGAPQSVTLMSLLESERVKDSEIQWSNVRLLPTKHGKEAAAMLATEPSGSHYYAARDTDAAYVRVKSMNRTNPAPEIEKFLFYRGVGNFPTPLVVRVGGDGGISMTNTGTEPLKHMILLTVSGGSGSYRRVDALKRGAETPSYDLGTGGKLPMAQLRKQVEDTMTEDLVAEGLYLREARAMVNTWRDSWFCEEGTRVLYVLPRKWTDETLPLEMKPTPKELVRVMVGRAEVIMPSVENHLAEEVGMVEKGETGAAERLKHSLRSMGRFGEPALIRAIAQNKVQWDHQSKLYALLRDDKAATALNFE